MPAALTATDPTAEVPPSLLLLWAAVTMPVVGVPTTTTPGFKL